VAAQPLPQPLPQPSRPQLPPPVAPTSPPAGSAALKTRVRAPLLTGSSDVHKVAQPSRLSSEEYAGAPCRRPVSDPSPACDEFPEAPTRGHKILSHCLPRVHIVQLCLQLAVTLTSQTAVAPQCMEWVSAASGSERARAPASAYAQSEAGQHAGAGARTVALVFLVCAAGVACLDGGLGLAVAVLRELLRGGAALAAVAAMLAAAAGAALAGEARACARVAGQVLPALPDASQAIEVLPCPVRSLHAHAFTQGT